MHIIQAHHVLKLVPLLKIYGVKTQHIPVSQCVKLEVSSTTLLEYVSIYVQAAWMMMGLFQIKENVTLNALHRDIIGILKTVDLVNPFAPFHQ